jgi:hypothetical protein
MFDNLGWFGKVLALIFMFEFNFLPMTIVLFLCSLIPTVPFSWKGVVVASLLLLAGECLGAILAGLDDTPPGGV